ncbi:acyltransferase [Novipirellula herctigrandis]
MAENSTLLIDGDLILGPGVFLHVNKNANLTFGGRNTSSGSGITCNTRVMVNQSLTIGSDSIIAWDCFISDCDWHQIHNQQNTIPVKIGDGVWIAQGATVLKGSDIGSGSIVASKSVVSGGTFGRQSLVAGNPAKVVRHPVVWSRDLDATH